MLKSSHDYRDKIYFTAFFLVELFASLEISAMLVAAPRITDSLNISTNLAGWIINSYLFPLFIFIILFLFLNRRINSGFNSKKFFSEGLLYFSIGNILCFLSADALLFFYGRVIQGIGAAMAFVGQLWSASEYFRETITKPLLWGQNGAAVGIIAGPLIAGYFVDSSADGWRNIFILNAMLSVVTLFLLQYFFKRKVNKSNWDISTKGKIGINFYIMIAAEAAIAIIAVGAEYFVSNYYQIEKNESALFVGWLTFVASLGIIAGSFFMSKINRNFSLWAKNSLLGLILIIFILGFVIGKDSVVMVIFPVFFIGFFASIGWMSVYAYITKTVDENKFLYCSLLYLIAQQVGNAMGIQIEELGSGIVRQKNLVLLFTLSLPSLIVIFLIISFMQPLSSVKKFFKCLFRKTS